MAILGKIFGKRVASGDQPPENVYKKLLVDYVNSLKGRQYLYDINLGDTDAGVEIQKLSPEESIGMVMMCINRRSGLISTLKNESDCRRVVVRSLLRRKLSFNVEQVVQLLEWVQSGGQSWYWSQPVASVLSACENLKESGYWSAAALKALKTLRSNIHAQYETSDTRKLSDRIDVLLGEQRAIPLNPGEAWSDAVFSYMASVDEKTAQHWAALLQQCKSASGSKASVKWLNATRTLIEDFGADVFSQACLEWFPLVDKPRTQLGVRRNNWDPDPEVMLDEANADVLKGLVWCCAIHENVELARALVKVALSCYKKVPGVGPRAVRVGNACIFALSNMPGRDGLYQLAVLKVRIKYRSAIKIMGDALQKASEREGITIAEMEEMGVSSYGLDDVGYGEEEIGGFTAITLVKGFKSIEITWKKSDGKIKKTIPTSIKSDFYAELKELRGAQKDIKSMLSVQKERIEKMFLKNQSWPFAIWQERYLNHPVVGVVVRPLIWCFSRNENTVLGIWKEGKLLDVNGNPVADLKETSVSLWHPISSSAEEIKVWRARVVEIQIVQPFKQAHREIYLLTDAEMNTGAYSNRFASHIIKQHQFSALAATRGWRYSLQGAWDGGGDDIARLDIPTFNVWAEFWVQGIGEYGADTTEAGIFSYVSTDQVRFYKTKSSLDDVNESNIHSDDPLPIADVPALVLSEVLRDVDLFVGVCSVGNDPEWSDGGPNGRYRDYWHSYSFGSLNASAETRKEILQNLIPKLKIADQCKFVDNFLVVEGKRRIYKIHLGSGNILMEPNNQYLCVVPDSKKTVDARNKVWLPFEGDNMMAIILSKVMMLAEDYKIRDSTINSQISP